MDIRCGKCNQKYHLPDDQVDDRRVYFFCENCGHRIVIDRKKEAWFSYRVLEPLSHGADIFEGIYLSFNRKNFFITFFLLLFWTGVFAIAALAASHTMTFFSAHIFLGGFIVFVMAMLFMWTFDIHLYLLSRNLFFRIKNGKNMIFSGARDGIVQDMPSLAFISMGIPAICILVILPVYLMKSEFGAAYAGFFHGFMLICALLILLILYCKNILMAFIALRPRSLGHTVEGFFRFLAVENINIPVYLLIISIVTLFFAGTIFLLMAGALAVTTLTAGTMLPSLLPHSGIIPGPLGGGTLPSLPSAGPESADSLWNGIAMAGFWTYLFFLVFISYAVNLVQSLASVAMKIMENNPGRSLGRGALLLGMVITTGFFVLLAATFLFHI